MLHSLPGMNHAKSWFKAVTWESFSILFIAGLTYIVTKNLSEMTTITIVYGIIKLPLYYLHERVWE